MVSRFLGNEEGSLTLLSLILFLVMLVLGGVAVDMLVFESNRTRLQNISDRATLAAADMDQTLDATQVVESYFEKEGLSNLVQDVIVIDNGSTKSVEVVSGQPMKTMFMRMVGTPDLSAPASAKATEAVGSVEISLVLDNSGSMGSTDGGSTSRLENLKTAVSTFLGVMYPGGADPNVTVSVIPYSTQVNIGPDLADILNVTNEHSYSHCVDFDTTAFDSLAIDTAATYQRSGHFDMFYNTDDPHYWKCRPEASQYVYVMGSDPAEIMTRVNALVADGQTSLDIGAKWGAALLDPSANSIVNALIGDPNADVLPQHSNRPVAYSNSDTVKALVLMTDGINTNHNDLNPVYKDGNSDLFRNMGTLTEVLTHTQAPIANFSLTEIADLGIDILSDRTFYNLQLPEAGDEDGDGAQNEAWWTPALVIDGETIWDAQWVRTRIGGASGAGASSGRMKFVELWDDMTPSYYADNYIYAPRGDAAARDAFLASIFTSVNGATKDTQLQTLCAEAETAGLTVYTVGLSVNDHARAILTDCASNENFFLDTSSANLETSFQSIADSIINQKLRLIQ